MIGRQRPKLSLKILALGLALSSLKPAWAQVGQEGYDDYGAFQTDPVDLDSEYQDMFGRFFQMNFHLGTGVLTGGLGSAYSAGILLGMKFIFFFDKMLGAELGVSYARHSGLYDEGNTGLSNLNLETSMTMVPLTLGLRYAFDPESLPRGFAAMNPYLVAGGEMIFRSEHVKTVTSTSGLSTDLQSSYASGAVVNTRGWGANFGGGFEFDVYRKKMFLGIDLRYHVLLWSDAEKFFGNTARTGNYITILGSASYNY